MPGEHRTNLKAAKREVILGVLASGRGSNLEAILGAIDQGRLPALVGVVISDQPAAYALERARQRGIPAVTVLRSGFSSRRMFDAQIQRILEGHRVELVVLAGFMRVLGEEFIQSYDGRIMNIHPSLLPSFPGREAQKQAFEYGVKVAGCTVHFVDAGTDTGPIILQAAVPVLEIDTPETLAERILREEHRIYPEAIKLYCQGRLQIEGRRVRISATGGERVGG
ncbi:MAG: phosphoribosylglycinamide formyltransferase [Syntrophothermus sp.]